MTGYYNTHLAAVSERFCLGSVTAMQQPDMMRHANITHAVVICSRSQLRHAVSAEQLSAAEVLHWLLSDPPLAQAVKSCQAVGVLAKLVPLGIEQVGSLGLLKLAFLTICCNAVLMH